jgi:hypothetical protein
MDHLVELMLLFGLLVLIFLGPEWAVDLARGLRGNRRSRQAP